MTIEYACMVPHPPLIIPAVGCGEEQGIADTIEAYQQVARDIAELRPETIIVSTPHSVLYADYFHISPGSGAAGSFADFRAPQTQIECSYDTELVERICELANAASFPAGIEGELKPELDHAILIPLWFIEQAYAEADLEPDYSVVRIGLSGLPLSQHYELGEMVQQSVEDLGRRCAYVASGDLSHKLLDSGPYGFSADGPVYDERIMDVMGRAAFDELLDFSDGFCESAAECGHRSFCIMAGALDGRAVEAEALSHEGPFGVGYGVCRYHIGGTDESRHLLEAWRARHDSEVAAKREGADDYVQLAREAVEYYVRTGKTLEVPAGLPAELINTQAGAFVSLHKDGALRGCIGTIVATQDSLAEEIIHNAIAACAHDPRFEPVREDELDALEISVDVLGDAEDIASPDELDPKRYGVIVSKGFRRGLLLPNLEGVDTVEEQLRITKQKAGISPSDDKVELQRFEVVRHE